MGMVLGIVKKRSTYYFRGYIPKKLRCIINRATIDKSLKTKNKKEALQLVKNQVLVCIVLGIKNKCDTFFHLF